VDPASADGPAPQALEVHAPKDLPREELGAVRERLASLQGYVGRPILYARLTLRHPETRKARSRWIADASIDLEGRPLAAHATGPDALAAADAVVDRLRRQVRRVVGAEVALRNDPRVIAAALGELAHEVVHRPETDGSPAGRRRIVHRGVAAIEPASIADAAADLLDADQEFRLFRHDETGEWLVIHRREDGRLGVVHPPWVPLTDGEDDILVVQPSPYDGPLTLEEAEAELAATDNRFRAATDNRFRYFVDAADERPKVLYVRHDGDYGLVEPLAGA
jgi:ribosome-associated translation inhibitor RaiA